MLKKFEEFISEGIADYKIEKLGSTESGKVVFSICNHPTHKDFTSDDHQNAVDLHDANLADEDNEVRKAHLTKQRDLHADKI
jgi:hypothetical protein